MKIYKKVIYIIWLTLVEYIILMHASFDFRRFQNISNIRSSPSMGTLSKVCIFSNIIEQAPLWTANRKTNRVPFHGCGWIIPGNGWCLHGFSSWWKTNVRNYITTSTRGWSNNFASIVVWVTRTPTSNKLTTVIID